MNKPKPTSIVVLVLSIILGFSLLFNVIQATTPDTGPYYLTIPSSSWRYNIGKFTNSSYYAINGENWHVDYVNTNLSALLSDVLTTLTPSGGRLLFKNGNYYFTHSVTIPNNMDNLQIYGEGQSTVFIMSPALGAPDNSIMFSAGTDVTNLAFSEFTVYMASNETFFQSTQGLGRAWFTNLLIGNEVLNYIGTPIYINWLGGYATYELFFSHCSINGGSQIM